MESQRGEKLGSDATPVLLAALLVTLVVVTVLAPPRDGLGWGIAVAGFFLLAALAQHRPALGSVLLVAYSLRAFVALLGYYAMDLPEAMGDAVAFEKTAQEIAGGGLDGVVQGFTGGSYFYAWLIGVLYWSVGHAPLLALFVNVLLGTGVVLNVYLLAKEIRGETLALVAASAAALFPSLIMYSAVLLREAGWVFLFTLVLVLFARWYGQPHRLAVLLAWLCFAVLAGMFHPYAAIMMVVLAAFATVKLLSNCLARDERRRSAMISLGVLVTAPVLVFVTGIGLGKVGTVDFNLSWLTGLQEFATRGRAAYPEFLVIQSWGELPWKLPIRVAYLLFTPFPWMIRSILDVIGAVDALLYLVLVGLILVHAKASARDPRLLPLLAVLLILLVVLSLTVGNYGTALRHRAKLVALMIVLVPAERLSWPLTNRFRGVWPALQRHLRLDRRPPHAGIPLDEPKRMSPHLA